MESYMKYNSTLQKTQKQ